MTGMPAKIGARVRYLGPADERISRLRTLGSPT
jgi:hypothetical protein